MIIKGIYQSSNKKFRNSKDGSPIDSINGVGSIEVEYDTSFAELDLPSSVTVLLSNGKTTSLGIVWDEDGYNQDVADTYIILGTLVLTRQITNPENIFASIQVTVLGESRTISSVQSFDDVDVLTGVTFDALPLPTGGTITLDNSTTVTLPIVWSEGSYNQDIEDDYNLFGVITTTDGISNPSNVTASISVSVIAAEDLTIESVASQTPINVLYNTPFGSVSLPSTVNTTLSDDSIVSISVGWAQGDYDQDTPDTYNITGSLVSLPEGITNPENVTATVAVTVLEEGGEEDGIHTKKTIGTGGSPLGYWQYLPTGYSNTVDTYPTIIYFHGAGSKGSGSSTDLNKVLADGPPNHISNGWKAKASGQDFLVFSPQTSRQSSTAWLTDGVPFIDWLINDSGYRIDIDRIYLAGYSMGAAGCIKIAADMTGNNPNKFAAIAPASISNGSTTDAANLYNKNVTCWMSHGTNDAQIAFDPDGKRVPDRMILLGADMITSNDLDVANTEQQSIWSIVAGGTHGSTQDRLFSTTHTYHNPNLYEWFLTKSL